MFSRENLKLAGVAVFCLLLAWTGPSIAHGVHASFAHNADKVDGKHAVGAGAGLAKARGKLVAHDATGKLPAKFIPTVSSAVNAANAGKLGGLPPTSYSRSLGRFAGSFTGTKLVEPSGRGQYGLSCQNDGVHMWGQLNALGAGAFAVTNLSSSTGPFGTKEQDVLFTDYDGTGGGFTTTQGAARFYARGFATNAAGTKQHMFEMWGRGTSSTGCWGAIETTLVK